MGPSPDKALALAAAALAALVLAAPAHASKEVVDYFGEDDGVGQTALGGEFSSPRDVAVNSTGAGPADPGDVYVADENHHRVQRFDSEGNFLSVWGANVLTEPANERQTVTVEATGGAYKLSFEGAKTTDIAYDASAAALEDALEALPTIGANNVDVDGSAEGGYTVDFSGNSSNSRLSATDVPELVAHAALLPGTVTIDTVQEGSGQYEICTVAAECLKGAATGAANLGDAAKNGSLDSPQSLAVDQDTGDVYVADRDNHRINVYDGAGAFIRSFGWDVVASGPGESGSGYEVCEDADGDSCQSGAGSAEPGAGQFAASTPDGGYGIALSPPDGEAATGTLFLANSGARRVETFGLAGEGPASFGSEAVFGEDQPRKLAVDSRGILYASNDADGGRVERYDTEDANGEGVGFLEPISAGVNEAQTVHFTGFETGDTFTLTCPGGEATGEIERDLFAGATRADAQAALEAECGEGDFFVSGTSSGTNDDLVVNHIGSLAETDLPQMTCATVSGSGSCQVSEEIDGHTGALLPGDPTDSAEATVGLEVDPDADEGGPDKDTLLVARRPLTGEVVVQQLGPGEEPGLAVPPAVEEDRHGEGAGFNLNSPAGLGLDPEGGRLFVAGRILAQGIDSSFRVYVLDDVAAAPEASIDPVSGIEAHSATFAGAVDPGGAPTRWRFEYVDDAGFQAEGFANAARRPLDDADAGNGEGPVAVETETAHTLVPGTLYHVRLVAERPFTGAEAIGGPLTFTTETSAPSIDGAAATVSTDEATLRGAIDPENGVVTDYRFEWGADAGYGNATPAGELPAGAGPVAVSAELTGLAPGPTYHYRLIATNATGTTVGPDRAFTTLPGPPQLPDRAYELVSPYPTGGVPVIPQETTAAASEDGDRVGINVSQPFPGGVFPPLPDHLHGNGPGPAQGASVRTPDGWRFGDTGLATSAQAAWAGWSPDATRWLFTTTVSLEQDPSGRVDPDDRNGSVDVYQRQPDNSLVWISRDPRIPVGTPQTAPGRAELAAPLGMATMSADGEVVVFSSNRQLLDADTSSVDTASLYKWSSGRLSFIGARPDGSVPAAGSALPKASGSRDGNARYAVSRDGSRAVFSAERTDGAGGSGIYVQSDGEATVEATRETGVAPLSAEEPYLVVYRGAAADVSRVFFTSSSRFTPDAGASRTRSSFASSLGDLYAYDLAADKVRDLTPRLDGLEDPGVDPAEGGRGRVLGVIGNSEDGRRVYFVADAAYETAPNPLGELPSPLGRNLYLAELGEGIEDPVELRFITALGEGDDGVWHGPWNGHRLSYASPDGSVLGFGSEENLTGQDTGGTSQLFVYDARAGTLECASCPSDGSLPAGDVNLGTNFQQTQYWQNPRALRRWVSSEGAVFFHTATPLLAADENVVDDVYEYRSGRLRLISPGTGTRPSRFMNASSDGSTVFFHTLEALVPRDKEPGVPKLYAARVGGGFPFTPEQPGCDLGAGACEGAGSSAPQVPGASTAVFVGPGNAARSQGSRCASQARAARKLSNRAKRLRRAARRAGNPRRAKRLRHRARRFARSARKRSRATKRCRRAARAASAGRGVGR